MNGSTSELIRQQDKEYQEALAKDMENMGIKSKPDPDTSPNHIKQLIIKSEIQSYSKWIYYTVDTLFTATFC